MKPSPELEGDRKTEMFNQRQEYTLNLLKIASPTPKQPPKKQESWEEEWDNMFNWAEQIKQKEINRWVIMYGFVPNDLKRFVSQTRQEAVKEAMEEMGKYIVNEIHEASGKTTDGRTLFWAKVSIRPDIQTLIDKKLMK